jgi:hypothetical protein
MHLAFAVLFKLSRLLLISDYCLRLLRRTPLTSRTLVSGLSTTLAVELTICTASTVMSPSTTPSPVCVSCFDVYDLAVHSFVTITSQITTWLVVTVPAIDPSRSSELPPLRLLTASVLPRPNSLYVYIAILLHHAMCALTHLFKEWCRIGSNH